VLTATETYRTEQDTLGEFIEECCHVEDWREERASVLFWAWQKYCESRGEWSGTQTKFGLSLTDRGFTKDKPTGGINRNKTVYHGIGLDTTASERLGGVAGQCAEDDF
jgi:phage/plasmid-associated DNA primase